MSCRLANPSDATSPRLQSTELGHVARKIFFPGHSDKTAIVPCFLSFSPVRLNLSAVPFQRNNSIFFSQQIIISISRFYSQPNRTKNDETLLLPKHHTRLECASVASRGIFQLISPVQTKGKEHCIGTLIRWTLKSDSTELTNPPSKRTAWLLPIPRLSTHG